jgi:tetratricopeptide (TPR) repeat protein
MKNFIFLLLTTIVVVNISCKKGDWYDVKSDQRLAVPVTLRDMQALMDDASTLNTNTPYLKELASDGHYLSDASLLTLGGINKNAYSWSKVEQYLNVQDWIANGFSGSYRKVYYSNLVLDGLVKLELKDMDRFELENIKGQALFHRSLAFFELAQVFSPTYDPLKASDGLGIPLRLESDVTIPSTRSTIQQSYAQIINDLLKAKVMLPVNSLYNTRPGKRAVFALLARVNLSMEKYEDAKIYADSCLNINSALMDYTEFNLSTVDNPISVNNSEVIFYSSMGETTPLAFNNNLIDTEWYNSYNQNDLRKKVFFNKNFLSGVVTYKGTYCGRGFNQYFTGLATDEIYLIRAECYAREGKILESMADLNTLLRTRWAGIYTEMTATNSEDALRKVLEERKKELILRGLRWSDLRRLNRDPRFAVTLNRTIGGKIYTLEPNSYKYTFPIPDDIIEMTGMAQNPGWE